MPSMKTLLVNSGALNEVDAGASNQRPSKGDEFDEHEEVAPQRVRSCFDGNRVW